MSIGNTAFTQRLEIRASKPAVIIGICLYLMIFLPLPVLGWSAFGPEALREVDDNEPSIWVFWGMRILLSAIWVGSGVALIKSWRLLRDLPVLFVLDKTSITNHKGVSTPWAEFQTAIWNPRGLTFHLIAQRESQFKNFDLKSYQIGDSGIEKAKTFMRIHAPADLIRDI